MREAHTGNAFFVALIRFWLLSLVLSSPELMRQLDFRKLEGGVGAMRERCDQGPVISCLRGSRASGRD
jgi:hypothetical protein